MENLFLRKANIMTVRQNQNIKMKKGIFITLIVVSSVVFINALISFWIYKILENNYEYYSAGELTELTFKKYSSFTIVNILGITLLYFLLTKYTNLKRLIKFIFLLRAYGLCFSVQRFVF